MTQEEIRTKIAQVAHNANRLAGLYEVDLSSLPIQEAIFCMIRDLNGLGDAVLDIKNKPSIKEPNFKKFWVVTVNGHICDASYSGKELKANHPYPSFRKFTYIKSWDELRYYKGKDAISIKEWVIQLLDIKEKESKRMANQ